MFVGKEAISVPAPAGICVRLHKVSVMGCRREVHLQYGGREAGSKMLQRPIGVVCFD